MVAAPLSLQVMTKPRHWPASLAEPDALRQLVLSVAQDTRSGVKVDVLTEELHQSYGLSYDEAAGVLEAVDKMLVQVKQPTRAGGFARIKKGALWLVLGLVFTCVSYMGAIGQAGNGRYYVATGAILWGAFTLMRGINDFMGTPK